MPEAHICLMCGGLALQLRRGRCPRCYTGHPYGAEYRRNRDALIRDWVARHGWMCPGLPEQGNAAHAVRPGGLTADHIKAQSLGGGSEPSNLRVPCGVCNRARGNRA